MQYVGKVSKRTQSSVVDIRFKFTKRVDYLRILILGVEGVLVMHGQLMEDFVFKSNLLMESLI